MQSNQLTGIETVKCEMRMVNKSCNGNEDVTKQSEPKDNGKWLCKRDSKFIKRFEVYKFTYNPSNLFAYMRLA